MNKKNIIIAGAGGFVGWPLVINLLKHDFNIYALDLKFSDIQKNTLQIIKTH